MTYAAIEPGNEGSLVGVVTCSKEPEPVSVRHIKYKQRERQN